MKDSLLTAERCENSMSNSMNTLDKIGIKFWLAVDVETKYILNAIAYLGKDERHASSKRLSDWVVTSLMEHHLGKRRNAATDNFFTSYGLGKQLRQKKTTIMGTVNYVRRELPPSAKTSLSKIDSSILVKADDLVTLIVH